MLDATSVSPCGISSMMTRPKAAASPSFGDGANKTDQSNTVELVTDAANVDIKKVQKINIVHDDQTQSRGVAVVLGRNPVGNHIAGTGKELTALIAAVDALCLAQRHVRLLSRNIDLVGNAA